MLPSMTDEEVIKTLTKLKGIGTWTAKMYLKFVLDRRTCCLMKNRKLSTYIPKIKIGE